MSIEPSVNDPSSPPPTQRSIGCFICQFVGGLGVSLPIGVLSYLDGGEFAILIAIVSGVIGAVIGSFTGGVVVVAYQAASKSGRFQLSLATCFCMMLILGLLLFGDLRGHHPGLYGWPSPVNDYLRNYLKWDWARNVIFDVCVHLVILSIGLSILTKVFPAKCRSQPLQ